jgi:DNA-binding IclR family transcriptional regulator
LPANQARLLGEIFHSTRRIPQTVRPDDIEARHGIPREHVVDLLVTLQEHGFVELRGSGLRFPYTLVRRPEDRVELIDQLTASLHDAKERQAARIQQTYELATTNDDIAGQLAQYFGE